MAGTASPWLIPSLDGLRLNWLANAEISASPQEPKKTGLSVFQYDQFEYAEFAKSLPWYVVELDARVRDRYQLDPRRWTKIGYLRGQRASLSQYFVLNPINTYPISSLRTGLSLMARQAGVSVDTSLIEPGFRPALEDPSTLWALIAKWSGERSLPRISCMTSPDRLNALLGTLMAVGLLTQELAEAYSRVVDSFQSCPHVYVSLDPADPNSLAVDFERPSLDCVPEACLRLFNEPMTEEGKPNYLKCRIMASNCEAKWTVYRPLAEVIPRQQLEELIARPRSIAKRAKVYYDENNASIIESLGSTYQAGLIGKSAKPDLTLSNLIKACGVKPGERVLDLGCGSGGPAIAMARSMEGVEVTGVTISASQAESAKSYAKAAGIQDQVRIVVGDYHYCPLPSESVDRVVFFESLGYAEDLVRVLREAYRCLRPGGEVYIKDVVRKPDPLSPSESLDLAEFDAVYAQLTPTPEMVARGMMMAGFQDLKFEPLTKIVEVTGFFGAMLDRKSADGLTEFGRRHYRAYRQLPVTFAHFSGSKPK